MPKHEFTGESFRIVHTIEEHGPHPSTPFDYYDDTFAVTILLQGEAICSVEGTAYALAPGDLVILSPDEIRSFCFMGDGVHERLSVYFSQAILSALWDSELPLLTVFGAHPAGVGNCITHEEYPFDAMRLILNDLCALADETNKITMRASRIQLSILSLLFLLYDARRVSEGGAGVERDPAVQNICRYVTAHLKEKLTLSHLQRVLLVSRYQLTVAFARATGMSLSQYILHKRLSHAVAAVRKGVPLEKAAEDAGFGSYSYFFINISYYFSSQFFR